MDITGGIEDSEQVRECRNLVRQPHLSLLEAIAMSQLPPVQRAGFNCRNCPRKRTLLKRASTLNPVDLGDPLDDLLMWSADLWGEVQ
jgi:hypothetical protein